MSEDAYIIYCSFCGRSQHEVQTMIKGPMVAMCDGCVDMATALVAERRSLKEEDHKTPETASKSAD